MVQWEAWKTYLVVVLKKIGVYIFFKAHDICYLHTCCSILWERTLKATQ